MSTHIRNDYDIYNANHEAYKNMNSKCPEVLKSERIRLCSQETHGALLTKLAHLVQVGNAASDSQCFMGFIKLI